MEKKHLVLCLLTPALLLLVPWVAMQVTDEVAWSAQDFLAAWALLTTAALGLGLAFRGAHSLVHRAALALALAGALLLAWASLAVGVIGAENHPANRLYLAVLALGWLGAICMRFEAARLARILFVGAIVVAVLPLVAWALWPDSRPADAAHVLGLNGAFALVFFVAAALLRRPARHPITSKS